METNANGETSIIYADLSYEIMSCVFEVHGVLGPGLSERIYEASLAREFEERGIAFERQKTITVHYKGAPVGDYILDMVVDGKIVLELKAVAALLPLHSAQARSYLRASGLKLATVINFAQRSVQSKRVVA